METYWFGYVAQPLWEGERLAYPFTESRLDWTIRWVIAHYQADPKRVYVSGGSMGAWGTMSYAFRRPELFAAVYPNRPRFVQTYLKDINVGNTGRQVSDDLPLPSGEGWQEHLDAIRFVEGHPQNLPFVGWNIGRQDGYATWDEEVRMIHALTAGRHGFAFAWNNGDHSGGNAARAAIELWYPSSLFALDQSYPAFTHSSIDDDPGSGAPGEGDLEGGINLGFAWSMLDDSPSGWSVDLTNELTSGPMTVDVTPRRVQEFHPIAGSDVSYTVDVDGVRVDSGTATVDADGLVTVAGVALEPGKHTQLHLIPAG